MTRAVGGLRDGSDLVEELPGAVRDFPSPTERLLDGDGTEAKRVVRDDPDAVVVRERAVQADDLGAVLGADLAALVAEALAHLDPQVAGVDELDLALALGGLAVGEHPDVGGDARVVEE